MFRRLRENGPAVLVPLAWTFVTAAHLDLVATRTVLVAHLVMDAVLVAFTAASWREMRTGVLLAWKAVLLGGLVATVVGTAALAGVLDGALPLALAVVAWMLLPGAALAYTGRRVGPGELPAVYTLGAALSGLGAVVYLAGPLAAPVTPTRVAGLTLANAGQTAGIVVAVLRY